MEKGEFILDEPIDKLKEKVKKIVTDAGIPVELPCIFKKESGYYKEYFIYPFEEAFRKTWDHAFIDMDLNEIIKAFLGGSYDKERIS
ncbi:MAG: hypothetical protein A2Y62_10600 [Candidatus Fischerbacteria bacterium RBG_13_37_8]|uniref:Uncharacterized protein n=1 Tax=Candidatus Fischerbacteria bacterium RBG_13_37_8 TaxID=1817863 RepID=A0A1F5VTL6_9BACT|nr:MAG: hypothetical protein A2Y62_10600 [Candidatus Fischerbacteria bacterium RBG_13_37_8]